MEPRIQYATSNDGVRLAYFAIGQGEPLVLMPSPPISHLSKAMTVPPLRSFLEGLGEIGRLVAYDGRGFGLSERKEPEFSIRTQLLDLEAIIAQLRLERFAILAHFDSAPAAIAYSARAPVGLTHLIVWSGYASGAEQSGTAEFEAMIALMDKDWGVFTQFLAHSVMSWSDADDVERFTEFVRASAGPDVYKRAWLASAAFDVSDLLPQVAVPTLVMDRQGNRSVELSTRLAAAIPEAELCLLEGTGMVEWAADIGPVIQAIGRFLEAAGPEQADEPRGTVRTVVFTDLAGSSEMMSRLGDEAGREVLREHERITREVLAAHGGTEVKTMGDGFMASFGSVTKAVECAIALQRVFEERSADVGAHGRAPLRVRIGLSAGEPIEEEGPDGRSDLFGSTVILAARIAAQAEGGEVLASMAVRELCAGKGFLFADRGDHALRGFEDPVRVFEISWRT